MTSRTGRVVAASAALLGICWIGVPASSQSGSAITASSPSFLEAGRCYRFTFPITGAPNWRVLEVLSGGWIKAEVDAGAASAKREPAWINTAQIITVRDARCSGD